MTCCNRCNGTGFLNLQQIPAAELSAMDNDFITNVLAWIAAQTEPHDVQVCDCCGDGDIWFGTPGEHYGQKDPAGKDGPYAYNGGLCECN